MTRQRFGLPPQALWLLLISGVFSLSVGLSNTFVNVYLWKVDKSYGAIGWYNLVVYVALPLAFVMAGIIAKRLNTVWTLRIGILLHVVFYAIALFGGTRVARLPWLLGAVMGLAGGFYWFSFNLQSTRVTEQGARDRFYGYNGVMGAVAGMVAPPVAGYLIGIEDRFGGLTGYHVTFALSLGLFMLAIFLCARIPGGRERGRLHLWRALRMVRERAWGMLLLGCLIYGLREGVFLFLIGLLLYIATGSELRLGEFVLLQSALSFLSFYVVGKLVKPKRRLWVLGMGAIGMAGAATLFLLPTTAVTLTWYGSIIAVVLPLFLVPLQGFVYDAMAVLSRDEDLTMEHVIAREIFENIGRVLGISAFIVLVAVRPSARAISHFAVSLGFVQLMTWACIAVGKTSAFAQQKDRGKASNPENGAMEAVPDGSRQQVGSRTRART
ncbi:MAG: MFS transporter [Alicyclobacillus sp.]|nr:MFS transporter [Alicyclobacillus sp.]